MSQPDDEARRRPEVALTLGVAAAIAASLLPYPRVLQPDWIWGTSTIVLLILAAGFLLRLTRLPAIAATAAEILVWIAGSTLALGGGTAILGIIPTVETFRSVPGAIEAAMAEIVYGTAPLPAEPSLVFLVVSLIGLLTIVIDHVVISTRMPLLAAVGLIAVWLIPGIAVPAEIDLVAFLALAVVILFLMRAETRTRRMQRDRSHREYRPAVTAMAAGIGAIALVVTVAATPLLPEPAARPGTGLGGGNSINASLQLGADLRQPADREVLRLWTDAASAPYLRVATLSTFNGRVWLPDDGATIPLDEAFEPPGVDGDIAVEEFRTDVEVTELTSSYLPVPFPAVSVEGVEGEWAATPLNHTVSSRSTGAGDQRYEVVTRVPQPSLQQVRAVDADIPQDEPESWQGSAGTIAETADDVTADARTDYDRLTALQNWFRGGTFTYSLSSPVEAGFDGSGIQAIDRFLEVRSGYCVHFASAFAVMARTLDMSSRIVVGYLPGSPTSEQVDEETVYSVTSSQLHAWPEVFFDGIGWVAFEPTVGLGEPTNFLPALNPGDPGESDDSPSAGPSESAAPSESASPDETAEEPETRAVGMDRPANPLPALAIGLGIVVLLVLPGVIRYVRRRRRLQDAGRGDATAAWRELLDTAIDLGITVPAHESPRVLGDRLVREHGAPEAATAVLVEAIEHRSYARDDGGAGAGSGTGASAGAGRDGQVDLAGATTAATVGLRQAVDGRSRFFAITLPRSLVTRPHTRATRELTR